MEQEAALYHTHFSATPAYSVRRKKNKKLYLMGEAPDNIDENHH